MIVRSICYFKTRGESSATVWYEKKTEYNDVKGMKEESGGKKLSSFERFICDTSVKKATSDNENVDTV